MYERSWTYGETRLKIKSDSRPAIRAAIRASLTSRRQLERFIIRNPEFRYSLESMDLDEGNHPRVVDLMSRASRIAEIGPFAAVAGSISQVAAEAGMRAGSTSMLVDNGGDVAIFGEGDFQVGIYAGRSTITGKLALSVESRDLPIGICTSSGSVGHSISFGDADAVVVVAEESSVADAAATAVANEVEGNGIESSIKSGLDRGDDIPEIEGCLIVRGDRVGVVGKLPRILPMEGGGTSCPELEPPIGKN